MYKQFYNLREAPFSLNTDPRFFYYNEEYRQALKYISYGIKNREGFVEITGQIGTGKTTFCHALINRLGMNTSSIFLPNAYFSELEFLEIIARRLGIDCWGNTQSEILQAIADYLLNEYSAGRNVVLIFDEAQNLSPGLLEQIRLLSNIGSENNRPLQIVLVGQPELETKLQHSILRNLDQRISLRYQIKPLKKKEIEKYIFHRLKVAGYTGGISFTKGALNKIYHFSKGLPRLINIVCDKSLLVGYFFKSRVIDRKIVGAAIRNTQSRWYHFPSLFFYNLSRSAVKVAVMIMVLFLLITWKYQHKLILWTKKVSPSLSVIKAVVLNRLHLPPVEEGTGNGYRKGNLLAEEVHQLVNSSELKGNPRIICAAILIKMWGIDQPVNGGWKAWKQPEVGFLDISHIARKYGLAATQLETDLAELQAIDLPCILLQVYDHELPGLTPMVLAKLSQNKAILYHPIKGAVVKLPPEDLARHWSGKAIILWRNLDQLSEKPLFSRGVKQEEIHQVGIRLRQLGYIKDEGATADEQTLREAIRKFQQDNQLKQDGVLGTPSKIALYRILGSPFSPSLSGEG
jgi:general secretion pathway protein A